MAGPACAISARTTSPMNSNKKPVERRKTMSENLKFSIDNGIATITLDRPEKLNAFTDEMLEDWLTALEECRVNDEVRVIVITGAGRAFTTGGDVSTFDQHAAQTARGIKSRVTEGIQRLPKKLAEIDKPVIAAMNGIATGGGVDVALACDIRFAAESARFAETYVKIAMIPGAGGAYMLPRLVGLSKALELLWTGDFVDAREAERIGLVNKVFPDAELMARTYEFARRLADGPPLAIQLVKRVARMGLDKDLATGLEIAAANLPVVRSSEDHKEAVAAFKEKRRPQFKGR
ncbi:MAG: enoyl-CoA hydratase-related protein [Rhodopila sp.]|nr:enoyl-CoA hydratase-related protein [Rhodopila sp.]